MSHKDYEELIRQSDMMEEEELLADEFVKEREEVVIPESLQPENIEKLLKSKQKKKKNRFAKYVSIAASAAVVLGVTAYGMLNMGWFMPTADELSDGAAPLDTKELVAEEQLDTAESYKDIYDAIQAYADEFNDTQSARNGNILDKLFGGGMKGDSAATEDMAVAESSMADATMDTGASSDMEGGYSETNTREEGIGEADIVKTDGNYIYLLNEKVIQIIDIQNPQMEAVGEISLVGEVYPSEMFVQGDKLVIFYDETTYTETDSDEYGAGYHNYAVAETFDIKDRTAPKSIGKISQSGQYESVRISDGYYYMFSKFYADWGVEFEDQDSYVPMVQGKMIESDHVYMPKIAKGNQFTVISAFSLDDPDKVADSKAVLSKGGQLYVSAKHIYIYENIYDKTEDYNQTSIRKIAYDKGELTGVAQTKIWGYINDSFSIDEYKGNLRVVTTVDPIIIYESNGIFLTDSPSGNVDGKSSNALYVLDEKLDVVGKIERLAPDESVYSARLMGDTGYFVTFRQVDPLFSVDLSDPTNPKVIGELKIPGFSEYLHPYGDGLLLGIGMNADESGFTDGVKLSMFDISDPANVTEIDKTVLENVYSTDVAYNYKSVLADVNKNLIGFTAYGEHLHYLLYSYDRDNGFTCLLDREINGWGYNIRGLYSGDVLYLVEGNAIESFDLHTFEKIDDIVL